MVERMVDMFEIGDKVRVTHILATHSGEVTCEDTGTVYNVDGCSSGNIGVEFERNVGGHNLYGAEQHCKNGHGWYINKSKLEKIKEEANKMKIEYTYKEPEERPIKRAEFVTAAGNIKYMFEVLEEEMEFDHNKIVRIETSLRNDRHFSGFSKQDFAAFAALVARIDKQIND